MGEIFKKIGILLPPNANDTLDVDHELAFGLVLGGSLILITLISIAFLLVGIQCEGTVIRCCFVWIRPFLPFEYDFRPVTLMPLEVARLFVLLTVLLWSFGVVSPIIPNNALIVHDITTLLAFRIKTHAHAIIKTFYHVYFLYSFLFFTFTKVMVILWYYGVEVSLESIAYTSPLVVGFIAACVFTILGPFAFICLQVFCRHAAATMDTCAAVCIFLACVAGFMTAPAYMNYYPSLLVEYAPIAVIMLLAGARLLYTATGDEITTVVLPEVSMMWSGALAMLTSCYMQDTGNADMSYLCALWLLPAMLISLTHIALTLINFWRSLTRADVAPETPRTNATVNSTETSYQEQDQKPKEPMQTPRSALRRLGSIIRRRDRTNECVICQEEYENDNDAIGILRTCGHYYHFQCIKSWLNTRRGRTLTCPVCRCSPSISDVIELSYLELKRAVLESRSRCTSAISRKISLGEHNPHQLPGAVEMVMYTAPSGVVQLANNPAVTLPDGINELNTRQRFTVRSGAQQNLENCGICKERYEGDPHQLVVGYLHGCGHVFHLQCIYNNRQNWRQCPDCIAAGDISSDIAEPRTQTETGNTESEPVPGQTGRTQEQQVVLARLSDLS